jgi:hypothetical protein
VREALDQLVLPSSELERLEHLAHAPADSVLVVADPEQAGMKTQKLAGSELLVDERAVGNESERRFRRLGMGGQVVSVHQHTAGGRLQETADHAERGGLAGAVWPEKPVDLARGDVEADAVHGCELPVRLDQILNGDHRCDGGD